MAQPLIECVPNFSEGRDARVIEAIEQAIRSVSGVMLLRSEMDPDHNRSVITFAGAPEAVSAAFEDHEVSNALLDRYCANKDMTYLKLV